MRKSHLSVLAIVALGVSAALAATSGSTSTGVVIGQAAPTFTLQNQDGKNVSLSDYAGKIVVLEWVNPECPFVQRHYQAHTMTTLASKYQPEGVVWLSINSTHGITNDADKKWSTDQSLSYPVLNDSSGTVGHAYGSTNTPGMFIINKDGKLVYKGAIDNDRDGDKTTDKVNYVDKALGEILAGKSVSTPETTPYGCTVKYAD